jgi:hypothetical protein
VAVIQLAMPLDGPSALEVVTYDAKGQLTGSYGVFRPLPAAAAPPTTAPDSSG